MVIRPYHPDDELDVIALWERAGLTRPWNNPRSDILRKSLIQGDWFLLGVLGNRIIATLMAGYEGHRGWINYLAIDPDFQRTGYGRAIMAHAEGLLLAAGCPKINVLVRKDNTAAVDFYERLGFRQDEVICLGKRLISDD